MRPDWDSYYLGIAEAVAARADCTRLKVGTIIVKDHVIVGHGYNGSPPGKAGCLSDGACPRGRHYAIPKYQVPLIAASFCSREPGEFMHGTGCWCKASVKQCACGSDWPCADYAQPLSSYDTGAGACTAVHSEANAIIRAGFARTAGATLYTVPGEPCGGCSRLIEGALIARVVYPSQPRLQA